jgi:hypothetical protein
MPESRTGAKRRQSGLESHLVVPLARAAVRDHAGAGLVRDPSQVLDDQRP